MTINVNAKGDRAEREAAKILADQTGFDVRRKLGAGRLDDTGDLDGIPHTVVQVKDWKNTLAAIRSGVDGATDQQRNARAPFGFAMVRLHGGRWVCCLTVEQMATYIRETAA